MLPVASPRWHALRLFPCLVFCCASAVWATESRFFFSGDGAIEIHHGHFDEKLAVRYRDHDGRYDPEALAVVGRFFRSRDDGRVGEMSLRLIELIDFVEDRYRPARIVLVSGYRSPDLNQRLRAAGARVANSSLHREGLAADLQFPGVDLRRMWVDLRDLKVGGVGYYQQQAFLHLDTGRPRFWEPQTSRVDENLSAGNARLFARTDFDRYRTIAGAVVGLHSVTAMPLSVARQARFGSRTITLQPLAAEVRAAGECYVFDHPLAAYRFRVAEDQAGQTSPADAKDASPSLAKPNEAFPPQPIRLSTCPPRVGATPEKIESNPVQLFDGGGAGKDEHATGRDGSALPWALPVAIPSSKEGNGGG